MPQWIDPPDYGWKSAAKSKFRHPPLDLSAQIVNYFGIKQRNGDVGIEIEAEGDINPLNQVTGSRWGLKQENSLRNNGFEMATNTPLLIKNIPETIDQYKALTKGSKFDLNSWRTSVHVHCNYSKSTIGDVYRLAMAFWMFEGLFTKLNGSNRQGNVHCLRLQDADGTFTFLREALTGVQPFMNDQNAQEYRYAAMNLASLAKFGSVEFRFMKFPENLDDISMWARTLHNLCEASRGMSFAEIEAMNREPDWRKIVEKFGQEEIVTYALGQGVSESYIDKSLRQHADYAFMLLVTINSLGSKKTQVTDYWGTERDEDMAPDPEEDLFRWDVPVLKDGDEWPSDWYFNLPYPPPEQPWAHTYNAKMLEAWLAQSKGNRVTYWNHYFQHNPEIGMDQESLYTHTVFMEKETWLKNIEKGKAKKANMTAAEVAEGQLVFDAQLNMYLAGGPVQAAVPNALNLHPGAFNMGVNPFVIQPLEQPFVDQDPVEIADDDDFNPEIE